MIIKQIHIDSFGNLVDKTLELKDAVNIIEGANESGKSTIAAFIKFIFYGLSGKSRDKMICDRDRFINWDSGSAGGYMVIKTEEAEYRIERTIILTAQKSDGSESKKSYREGCQIIDLSNNSPISGYTTPGDYFLGVDEELFEKSAFVSQLSGAKIDGNKLLDSIENILFSASENINITKALKKLDASRVALLHKNGGGGQIFELETTCAQLEIKLENAKKISTDILNNENSLREAKKNLEITTKKRDKLAKQIKSFENSAIISLFDKLHALESRISSTNAALVALKEKYTVGGFYPDSDYVSRLEKLEQKLSVMKDELLKKEKELESARGGLDNKQEVEVLHDKISKTSGSLDTLKQKKFSSGILSTVFIIFALMFSIGGAASLYFEILPELGRIILFSSILPVILFIVFICVKVSAKNKLKLLFNENGVSNEEELITKLKNEEDKLTAQKDQKNRLQILEQSYKETLESLGTAEKELKDSDIWNFSGSFEENLKHARSASEEMSQITGEQAKLEEMLKMLKSQLEAYDEEKIRDSIDEQVDISSIDASNLSEKRHEYEFCLKASEALEKRTHELEKTLASLYPLSENPSRIAEKIELARSFIEEYRKKHAAYLLAGEKINEAGESMRESISPKLAQFTSKIMSELTHGKYFEIGINSEIKVSVRTQNGMKELEYLSAGTQDIVYISLRLALINTLFRKNSPSVIFDESFARLDDNRLSQMLKLLKLTGKSMQCIVLTSGSREKLLMDVTPNASYIKL